MPLEKFMSTELILGREVLAAHEAKCQQSVNQEIPSKKDGHVRFFSWKNQKMIGFKHEPLKTPLAIL